MTGRRGTSSLVDGGETQGLLRLHRDGPDDLQVRGPLDGVVEQRGLADAGLAPEDQRTAHAGADAIEQRVQRLLFTQRSTNRTCRP